MIKPPVIPEGCDWVIEESLPRREAQELYEELTRGSLTRPPIVFRRMKSLRMRFLSWLRGGRLSSNCTEWLSTGPIHQIEFAETEEGADMIVAGSGHLIITDVLV